MSNQFESLNYDDFRRMALDKGLSSNEKVGFPDHYREGYGEAILKNALFFI